MLDKRSKYRLDCKHPLICCKVERARLTPQQVTAEASFLSIIAVMFVFVLIGVCPNSVLPVLVHADKNCAEKCATL